MAKGCRPVALKGRPNREEAAQEPVLDAGNCVAAEASTTPGGPTVWRSGVAALALEGMIADDALPSAVDRLPVEALLFQAGYLTVVGEELDDDARLYRLDYPNQEAKRSLNAVLLQTMAPDAAVAAESRELRRLANDFAGLENLFRAFLASNEWYANTAGYEGHYASVFYSHFVAADMDVRADGDLRVARPLGPCARVRRRLPARVQGRGEGPGAGREGVSRL